MEGHRALRQQGPAVQHPIVQVVARKHIVKNGVGRIVGDIGVSLRIPLAIIGALAVVVIDHIVGVGYIGAVELPLLVCVKSCHFGVVGFKVSYLLEPPAESASCLLVRLPQIVISILTGVKIVRVAIYNVAVGVDNVIVHSVLNRLRLLCIARNLSGNGGWLRRVPAVIPCHGEGRGVIHNISIIVTGRDLLVVSPKNEVIVRRDGADVLSVILLNIICAVGRSQIEGFGIFLVHNIFIDALEDYCELAQVIFSRVAGLVRARARLGLIDLIIADLNLDYFVADSLKF